MIRRSVNPKQGKPPPDPKQMFQAAFVFEEASATVSREMWGNNKMRLAVTWGVLGSFATELYLKCLLVIEHNARPPDEHNLKELFRLLPRHVRRQLTKVHNDWIKDDQSFKNMQKIRPDWKGDLESLLEQSQDAFTQFRYAYEGVREGAGFGLSGFNFFLRKRILKLHPDWERW